MEITHRFVNDLYGIPKVVARKIVEHGQYSNDGIVFADNEVGKVAQRLARVYFDIAGREELSPLAKALLEAKNNEEAERAFLEHCMEEE